MAVDAPLMSAGLDSIDGTEFTNTLAQQFEVELPPTLMFDYPTIESMAGFIAEEMPTVTLVEAVAEEQNKPTLESDDEAPKSIWDIYSELKLKKQQPESFVPPAAKSARRALVLFAFTGSGSKHILSSLSSHQHLCVCEDLCLVPFKTVLERNNSLSSRSDNVQDGLDNAVKTLRNSKMSKDTTDLFDSVTQAYRALQEWCSPRILVEGTEAYAAVPE